MNIFDGFSSKEQLQESLSDGFVNQINDHIPLGAELLCNQDGYEFLTDTYGEEFGKTEIEATTRQQVQSILKELNEEYELPLTQEQVVASLDGALRQSFENHRQINLDNDHDV